MATFIRISVVLTALMGVACTTPDPVTDGRFDVAPGARPALETDEAGLWMQMDRVEGKLRTAGNRVTDPALNEYVSRIVCRIADAYCGDVRVYIVEIPYFNATMAPNGFMQVWTGLLLRAQNEAQVAYVLGHELGHYVEKHSVERWRDIRTKTDAAFVFSVMTAGVGLGPLGILGQLAALGSTAAYSRDQERQADDIGLELMASAGYDPREGPKVWQALLEERKAADDDDPFIFMATHPAIEERYDVMREQAEALAQISATQTSRADVYQAAIGPHRAGWLRDELRLREFDRTTVLLEQLQSGAGPSGELLFFEGEVYRLRGESDDDARASVAYQKAIAAGDAPAEVHRSLAQVYLHRDEKANAKAAYRRYLEEKPDASDRAMVEHQIALIE